MTEIEKTMRQLSDHQILGLVEEMLDGDHMIDDATVTYVAAHEEAVRRGLIDNHDCEG